MLGGVWMFSEVNAELVAIQGELRRKAKYEAQLEDFKRELKTIEETLSQLGVRFEAEKKDVEKLERMGLTNLLATLSGKKDEKLSKEKQEMMAAEHQLEEAAKTKQEIEEAILELKDKLAILQNTEENYQQLLFKKERMIKSSGTDCAVQLFELSEQEGMVKAYQIELEEAIEAGEQVKEALEAAIYSLEKAVDWGTFDMLGGGAISGMVKHQHIDDAEESLHHAQTKMRKFQKELLDVQEEAELTVDISGMLKFADFFFDGFIVDFMVQGKIKDSLEQTIDHLEEVAVILLKLKDQTEDSRVKLACIQKEKLEIVERS
jgi:DNA repair exonuclease SbcCD ATPase subunit